MVDIIRRSTSSLTSQGTSPSAESLRTNFKSLTSGLKVQDNPNQSPPIERKDPESDKVNGILHSLNDAVSFSALALKSLEHIGDVASDKKDTPLAAVKEFARDLEKVRKDISSVLDSLRDRAETAEVIQENLASSDVRLRDVHLAQQQVDKTGSQIHHNVPQAINAHAGLVPERVAILLAD